jgi:hypothetical protein
MDLLPVGTKVIMSPNWIFHYNDVKEGDVGEIVDTFVDTFEEFRYRIQWPRHRNVYTATCVIPANPPSIEELLG